MIKNVKLQTFRQKTFIEHNGLSIDQSYEIFSTDLGSVDRTC